jgi:hypothetical protein
MEKRKDAEPWERLALEQARLIVWHLEHEQAKRPFVREHAMMLLQVADSGMEVGTFASLIQDPAA